MANEADTQVSNQLGRLEQPEPRARARHHE